MVPLEQSGKLLGDVARTFYTVSSADATPDIQQIEETLAPLMSAHQDSIQLDAQLYWRIKTIHDQLDELALDPEQRYLVERHYREMSQAGAGLDDEAKEKLTALNQRLSTLTTTFEKNLLNDTNDLAVVFDDAAELDGLTDGELSAAAQAAADRGLEGKWVVTLTLFTGHPYLSSLTEPREPQADPRRVPLARARAATSTTTARCCSRSCDCAPSARRLLGYDSHAALHHVGRDRRVAGGGARPASPAGRAGGAQRPRGAGRAAGHHRCRARAVPARGARLGVLHREGARGRVRPRPQRTSALVRGRAGAAGRRLPRGARASTASRSPNAPICPPTTPTPGSSRSATRTAPSSGCSSSTSTPATRSAAARG